MRQFLTVVLFTLATIGFFAAYSNYGIPQIEPAPPPTEEKLDLGSMNMDQFIALGGKIFNGKGTCTLRRGSTLCLYLALRTVTHAVTLWS